MSENTDISQNDTRNGDYKAVLHAIDFMENNPPEPFVIWFNGIGAHPAYGVHREYEDAFPPE